MAIPLGASPTSMVAISPRSEPRSTVTLSSSRLVTKTACVVGSNAAANIPRRTPAVAITVSDSVSTTVTLLSPRRVT